MIIYLGGLSPTSSCSLPENIGNEPFPACQRQTSSLLGLAPNGGCLAAALLQTPVVSYTTISPLPAETSLSTGGIFLWPSSGELPRPGNYPALCSVECGLSSTQLTLSRDHPANLGIQYYLFSTAASNFTNSNRDKIYPIICFNWRAT